MLLWALTGAVALVMLWFRAALLALFPPDNFPRDPLGWLSNQGAHAALGLALVLLASLIGWGTRGEYPYRLEIWAVCLLLVLVFELGVQGWNGADTLHDTAFLAGWGAGGPLLVFQEIAVGSLQISGNGGLAVALLCGALVHLAWGMWARRVWRV